MDREGQRQGIAVARYVGLPGTWGGLAAAVTEAGTAHYHFDLSANTRLITDDAGSVLNRYVYESFGPLVAADGEERFGFGGQFGYQRDDATGLLLLGLRHYDPRTGRFLSVDPLGYGGGGRLYGYGDNDPVSSVDPWGLRGWPSAGAMFGALGEGSTWSYGLGTAAAAAGQILWEGVDAVSALVTAGHPIVNLLSRLGVPTTLSGRFGNPLRERYGHRTGFQGSYWSFFVAQAALDAAGLLKGLGLGAARAATAEVGHHAFFFGAAGGKPRMAMKAKYIALAGDPKFKRRLLRYMELARSEKALDLGIPAIEDVDQAIGAVVEALENNTGFGAITNFRASVWEVPSTETTSKAWKRILEEAGFDGMKYWLQGNPYSPWGGRGAFHELGHLAVMLQKPGDWGFLANRHHERMITRAFTPENYWGLWAAGGTLVGTLAYYRFDTARLNYRASHP